jgi:hypothetical protein
MAGPIGVLQVSPTAATIVVVGDIDGTPLGGAAGKSASGHHRC